MLNFRIKNRRAAVLTRGKQNDDNELNTAFDEDDEASITTSEIPFSEKHRYDIAGDARGKRHGHEMGLVMHSPFKDKHTVHAEVGMKGSSAAQRINIKGETTESDGTTATFDGDAIQDTTEEEISERKSFYGGEEGVEEAPLLTSHFTGGGRGRGKQKESKI